MEPRRSTGPPTCDSPRLGAIRADRVTEIYARTGWYRERPEPEEEWRGVLRRREPPAGPAGRPALAFALEVEDASIDVYAPESEALLQTFVGLAIVARGKLVDLSDEGFGKELWPASIGTAPVQVSGIGQAGQDPNLGGVYRAIVVEARRGGRIRLRIPAVSGAEELWALSFGGNHAFVPDRGDEVIVAFEEGDPRRPIVLGRLWGTSDAPAEA